MSSMSRVMQAETKVVVVQRTFQQWCKDFMAHMHQRSKIVSLGIEIGVFGEVEMKARATWALCVVDMLTKKKGSGSVVYWDR